VSVRLPPLITKAKYQSRNQKVVPIEKLRSDESHEGLQRREMSFSTRVTGKKSAPNGDVKIGYYSIFLLLNDRKRSYESIGMVIYLYRSVVKKWPTPLQKVPRFERKFRGLTVQLSVFFYFFIFFIFFARTAKERKTVCWIFPQGIRFVLYVGMKFCTTIP